MGSCLVPVFVTLADKIATANLKLTFLEITTFISVVSSPHPLPPPQLIPLPPLNPSLPTLTFLLSLTPYKKDTL